MAWDRYGHFMSNSKYGGYELEKIGSNTVRFCMFRVWADSRRKGHGRRLFNIAKRVAKRKGYSLMTFSVDNPVVNVPIYLKFGAVVTQSNCGVKMEVVL
jgi:GNAT superfamily N-acetyltransferase